ncbi:DUF456 domain-containing protein [Verrucomicrobia bacterium]|nr:DUF456 domain-containing protein [Verrucomicrobiota bacterium]
MSFSEVIGLWLSLIVMLVGLVGCLIPALPSTPIILLAAVGHKCYFDDQGSSWWIIGLLLVITIVSMVIEHVASVFGAKKMGATKWGVIGAIVGAIVGFFFFLPGMILGPFIGAVGFELMAGRKFGQASKAGVGAILGLLAGVIGKIVFSLMMITIFTAEILWREF